MKRRDIMEGAIQKLLHQLDIHWGIHASRSVVGCQLYADGTN